MIASAHGTPKATSSASAFQYPSGSCRRGSVPVWSRLNRPPTRSPGDELLRQRGHGHRQAEREQPVGDARGGAPQRRAEHDRQRQHQRVGHDAVALGPGAVRSDAPQDRDPAPERVRGKQGARHPDARRRAEAEPVAAPHPRAGQRDHRQSELQALLGGGGHRAVGEGRVQARRQQGDCQRRRRRLAGCIRVRKMRGDGARGGLRDGPLQAHAWHRARRYHGAFAGRFSRVRLVK